MWDEPCSVGSARQEDSSAVDYTCYLAVLACSTMQSLALLAPGFEDASCPTCLSVRAMFGGFVARARVQAARPHRAARL